MVSERASAQYIIVDSLPGGLRDQLSMMLSGGSLMEASFLLRGKGTLLGYKRQTRTPKWVFLSQRFQKECAGGAYAIRILLSMAF